MNMILPGSPNGAVVVKTEDAAIWHDLFAQAERRIKEIEHFNEGLDIPAINELRYVSYHLLEMLVAPSVSRDEHGGKVVSHLKRAIYDACEALISIQLEELRTFQVDYRLVVVSEVIKDYSILMQDAEAASALIKGTQRGHDGREEYYTQALKHVDALSKINITLRAAREELNKKLEARRRDSRRWIIGVSVTVLASVVALIIKFTP